MLTRTNTFAFIATKVLRRLVAKLQSIMNIYGQYRCEIALSIRSPRGIGTTIRSLCGLAQRVRMYPTINSLMIGQVEPRQLWRLKGYGGARIEQRYFPARCYIQGHTSSRMAVRRHAAAEILTERAISRSTRSSFFSGCVRSMPMARSSEFEALSSRRSTDHMYVVPT